MLISFTRSFLESTTRTATFRSFTDHIRRCKRSSVVRKIFISDPWNLLFNDPKEPVFRIISLLRISNHFHARRARFRSSYVVSPDSSTDGENDEVHRAMVMPAVMQVFVFLLLLMITGS